MSLLTTLLESSGSSTNNLLDFRGSYDASVNTFPATGGSGNSGAILKGDFWLISVGGTLGGSVVSVGDTVYAITDTPGQTAGNWAALEGNIGYTPENAANKDATGGYAGLTAFKLNMRNVANTFTSFFTNTNTASRTYTLQDRDGTIADNTDLALKGSLAASNTWTKPQRVTVTTLTDAATIAIDLDLTQDFDVVLGGNRTLGEPTNIVKGQSGVIDVRQDGTGGRTLAYAWPYVFPLSVAPLLSTGKYDHDQLQYRVNEYSAGNFTVTLATPGVFTKSGHGYKSGQRCRLTTTGALPTGLSVSTTYWINVVDANTFNLSSSKTNLQAGTYINTSVSQSGVHTITAASIEITLNPKLGA